jgi:hypothetical protein
MLLLVDNIKNNLDSISQFIMCKFDDNQLYLYYKVWAPEDNNMFLPVHKHKLGTISINVIKNRINNLNGDLDNINNRRYVVFHENFRIIKIPLIKLTNIP